jgi:tetratricopeptide (TPR) repeat protein
MASDDFPKIVEYGEKVLKEFPGDENTKGIFNHVNNSILKKVGTEQWNEGMDRLVDLYPVHFVNRLASRLWESGFPEAAQRVYQKILDNHPTETLACHKALFFMGRIEEDNQRYLEAIDYYEKRV